MAERRRSGTGPPLLSRDGRVALERGQREFDRGHLPEAIELLEQALSVHRDHVRARVMLAMAYARLRRVERALEQLEIAVETAPDAFAPRCALGELYLRIGIPDQGRPHLAVALERATEPAERAYVHRLLKEDREREKRRMPRPSFRLPIWIFHRTRG